MIIQVCDRCGRKAEVKGAKMPFHSYPTSEGLRDFCPDCAALHEQNQKNAILEVIKKRTEEGYYGSERPSCLQKTS